MKKIILFILILFVPFAIEARELIKNFEYELVGDRLDNFSSFIETSDNNFIIVGSSDSNEITTTDCVDAFIVKVSKTGKVIWKKTFGGSLSDEFFDVVETSDGGYLAVGSTNSIDIDGIDNSNALIKAIVVKYDINGDIVWKKDYGVSFFDSIALYNDGSFVVSGHSSESTIEGINITGYYSDGILAKCDENGNLIWIKNYGGSSADEFTDVDIINDSDIVVVGDTSSKDIDGIVLSGRGAGIILRFNKDGNLIWSKNYNGNEYNTFSSVEVDSEGNIIVVGHLYSTNIPQISLHGLDDALIVKYDKDGNIIWQKNYGGSLGDVFNNISLSNNGNYYVSGYTYSTDINNLELLGSGYYSYIVEYTRNGDLAWQKSFNVNSDFRISDFMIKNDDLAFIGNYSSLNPGIDNIDSILQDYKIEYAINTNNDLSNGTIKIDQEDINGIIRLNPDVGYEVDNIIVKDSLGNDVEVTKQADGTYAFELYDDVSVEVLFKEIITNPKTGVFNPIVFIPAVMFLVMCVYFIKSCEKSYEL